ncbi:MAG: hypothetical protein ABJA71_03720 [Ginsengibacter sp.]
MLSNLPLYISMLFIFTTILTAIFFIAAIRENNSTRTVVLVSVIICGWLVIHAILALKNFYAVTDSIPPRFTLLTLPPFLIIIILFITNSGRRFIDSLSLKLLTQLHVVRIFVEIILFWLFLYKFIPRLMTFEGRNFDILAGLSAPLVAYLGFTKNTLGKKFMFAWNIICLLLLLNIVVNAILSAPFPFQQFAFDQPNIAVLYFPFVWLPGFIVPVVLFSHLVLIRRLSKK